MTEIVSLVRESDKEAAAKIIATTIFPDMPEENTEIAENVSSSDFILGAFEDSKLVGAAHGIIVKEVLIVEGVATIEGYRRRHIGMELMAALEHQAVQRGARSAFLFASNGSAPFYKYLGYTEVSDGDMSKVLSSEE